MMYKTFSMLMAGALVCAMIVAPAQAADTAPFPDVAASAVYADAVSYAAKRGVFTGYPDGLFRPSNSVTRAEMAKILVAEALPNVVREGKNCFPDVGEEWFAGYVCEAKARGWVAGYEDGAFRPGNPVTFVEAAKMATLALGVTLPPEGEAWFTKFAQALADQKSVPVTITELDGYVTRADMAEILYRIAEPAEREVGLSYETLLAESGMTQRMPRLASCAELTERFERQETRYRYYPMPMVDGVMEESSDTATDSDASVAVPSVSQNDNKGSTAVDHSTTNVQTVGVDEGDIIKNDGEYLYVVRSDNTVRIVKAYPADEMREVAVVRAFAEKGEVYAQEVYVTRDRLIVLGNGYGSGNTPYAADKMSILPYPYYGNTQQTVVSVFDIAERSAPKLVREVKVDGWYVTSRLVGDELYTVSEFSPWYGMYQNGAEGMLPKFSDTATGGTRERVAECADIAFVPESREASFLTVSGVTLSKPEKEVTREVVLGRADTVYMSGTKLYMAGTQVDYANYQTSDPFTYIAPPTERTRLYAFGLSGGKARFGAQGVIAGTVLNKYSMDEYAGVLRVATTEHGWTAVDGVSKNRVVTLDGDLREMGAINDIAPGEKIYSARFMGKRGYLVTFESIDPLFVFDLSDPKAPRILGELKIPGYSDYLHPLDENHLIGFGKEVAVPAGSERVTWQDTGGMKMALFDVSNPSTPKALFTETIGERGTDSELLSNPKALLFDGKRGLLAFPVLITAKPEPRSDCAGYSAESCPVGCEQSWNSSGAVCTAAVNPVPVFQGGLVYTVSTEKGFRLRGRMTHFPEGKTPQQWGSEPESMRRIVYSGEMLYGMSYAALSAVSFDTMQEVKRVVFGE